MHIDRWSKCTTKKSKPIAIPTDQSVQENTAVPYEVLFPTLFFQPKVRIFPIRIAELQVGDLEDFCCNTVDGLSMPRTANNFSRERGIFFLRKLPSADTKFSRVLFGCCRLNTISKGIGGQNSISHAKNGKHVLWSHFVAMHKRKCVSMCRPSGGSTSLIHKGHVIVRADRAEGAHLEYINEMW